MKVVAFPATHRRAGVSGGQWLSMTIAVGLASCASPADAMPAELGGCNASGDAACSSEAVGGGAGGTSNGGVSGGEAANATKGTGGVDAAASGANSAGVADVASVPQPPGD
jgi:hypothetical protein